MEKVPRETQELLDEYVTLLKQWNKKINLVGKNTIDDIWERHIRDSFQLIPYLEKNDQIIDLGSGAGIPGIILLAMGFNDVVLVEADTKKAAFLLKAAECVRARAQVINKKIESVNLSCDVLTCRAFASINSILETCQNNIHVRKKLLLLKGRDVQFEITEAKKIWLFNYKLYNNMTSDGYIIEIDQGFQKL